MSTLLNPTSDLKQSHGGAVPRSLDSKAGAAGSLSSRPAIAVSKWARANRKTDSRPELLLRSALHRRGYRFRKNLVIRLAEFTIRPDIVFSLARVAVFVDGCFWHSCPLHGRPPTANVAYWTPKLARNVERDRRADSGLKAAGWSVVRLWEHVELTEATCAVARAVADSAAVLHATAACPTSPTA